MGRLSPPGPRTRSPMLQLPPTSLAAPSATGPRGTWCPRGVPVRRPRRVAGPQTQATPNPTSSTPREPLLRPPMRPLCNPLPRLQAMTTWNTMTKPQVNRLPLTQNSPCTVNDRMTTCTTLHTITAITYINSHRINPNISTLTNMNLPWPLHDTHARTPSNRAEAGSCVTAACMRNAPPDATPCQATMGGRGLLGASVALPLHYIITTELSALMPTIVTIVYLHAMNYMLDPWLYISVVVTTTFACCNGHEAHAYTDMLADVASAFLIYLITHHLSYCATVSATCARGWLKSAISYTASILAMFFGVIVVAMLCILAPPVLSTYIFCMHVCRFGNYPSQDTCTTTATNCETQNHKTKKRHAHTPTPQT